MKFEQIEAKFGPKWLDLGKFWSDLGKIKILHLPKHPISYGYGGIYTNMLVYSSLNKISS